MEALKVLVTFFKDIYPLLSLIFTVILGLAYFKFVKAPDDALRTDLKSAVEDIAELKVTLHALTESIDVSNQSRVKEAVRNEDMFVRVKDVETKLLKAEERINDSRVDIARISARIG